MAVMMSRFCRLWLLEKEEFCSTIFSSSSISSACSPACMKLFTATDTCSGFLLSGRAVDTTCMVRTHHRLDCPNGHAEVRGGPGRPGHSHPASPHTQASLFWGQ